MDIIIIITIIIVDSVQSGVVKSIWNSTLIKLKLFYAQKLCFIFFSVALQSFRTLTASHIGGFLNHIRHMVGFLGRVMTPSQGLYLHRTTQHRKTRDKHSCLDRDSNPQSQQPTGQDPRLRPHGHCDRLVFVVTL
jgi:hypothetical protein